MYALKQSQTASPLMFLMVDSTDHVTGKTGLSPTVTLSKNGGSFASPSGAVTEVASGWYKVAGNATDENTLGPLVLHATGTGADPTDVVFLVVAYDPQDSVRAGLTALPNAAAEASGGLYTRGTGAGQINQQTNGQIDANVARWLNGAIPAVNVTGVPKVDIVDWLGSAPAALSTNGYVQAMMLRWLTDNAGGTPVALTSTGYVKGDAEEWKGGTIPAVNVTGVPKVDLVDWLGSAPNSLSSGNIPADIKLWLTAAPAALTTNGYVQSMLLRWLTDNAAGTPDALSTNKVPADLKLWLATAPLALSSQMVQSIVGAYASGQAPLQPTVAGCTLDVSTTGECGVDWGNVGSPSTSNNLSGTTIGTVGNVTSGVSLASGAITSTALASSGGNAIADAILKRDWTAVTGEASRSVLNALRALRNRFRVASSTYTVYKEDDTTSAWSGPVTSDATADPVTGMDPT